MSNSRSTLATSTYAALRERIIRAEIPPGAKLNIREICERFEVGLSPAREALNRLSSEGFVQHSDQRGFRVAQLDLHALEDLTRSRCMINEMALRQSIERGDEAWEDRLALAFNRMNRLQRVVDDEHTDSRSPAWAQAHMDFHRTLIDGCGSTWITQFCDELFEASERYRFAARHAGHVRPDVNTEHEAIYLAVIRRNADQAVSLLTAHFEETAALVRFSLMQAAASAA